MPPVAQLGGGAVLGREAYQLWAALRPSSGLPLRGILRPTCRSLRLAGTIRSHPLLAMDVSHRRRPLDSPVPVHCSLEPSGESPPPQRPKVERMGRPPWQAGGKPCSPLRAGWGSSLGTNWTLMVSNY